MIRAKNMKISYKNIWCKDSCQKYEYLIQEYLVQSVEAKIFLINVLMITNLME